jgi:hypothetical protein
VVLEIGTSLGYQSAVLAELWAPCTPSKSSTTPHNGECSGSNEKATPTSRFALGTAISAGLSTRRSTR